MGTPEATPEEKAKIIEHFKTDTVSVSAVNAVFKKLRGEVNKDS